tara:strand:+ start:442 stop:912 length:471 start_codon:yes stop_codon:yes gene_type:complete
MFLTKYIHKILIFSLIIITFYNIFSIFILFYSNNYSYKNDGYFSKLLNYTPYKYSIFFNKPFKHTKVALKINSKNSKKLNKLLNATEKKSSLDYSYWTNKLLYQISNNDLINFEKNFQNSVILSRNNLRLKKSLQIFYLRNITSFSNETKNIVFLN